MKGVRSGTRATYHQVWRQFNNFIINLDERPDSWEECALLYIGHLTEKGSQSATLKSYLSAIKFILTSDGYQCDNNKFLFPSVTRACKLVNDRVKTRLPIHIKLLEMLLFEIERYFGGLDDIAPQPYLMILYQTIFITAYYGLMRIGELTMGAHPILAKDVHVGMNKNKILLVLHSSKTHGKESRPQEIKMTTTENYYSHTRKRHFCPFQMPRNYMKAWGNCDTDSEPYFIFRSGQPVAPHHVRHLLRKLLKIVNLNPKLYDCQSFRIGMASDMFKLNCEISRIRQIGRWWSNVVFTYLRRV